MPYDKIVDSTVLDSGLKKIADAIRKKTGRNDKIEFPNDMVEAISSIQSGSSTSDDTTFKEVIERTVTHATLPIDLTTIGGYSFYGCYSLETVIMPDSVKTIGNRAFYNCRLLQSVSLPSGLSTIETYGFSGCSNLSTATFKSKPTSIASNAFSSCTKLYNIYVPWSEGEVSNAPWGATSATIHYNYNGG